MLFDRNTTAILVLCLIATVVLTATRTRISSSAGPALVARTVDSASASDPDSPAWDEAKGMRIALSSGGAGLVRTATVRTLSDGELLYILLEWTDESPDLSFKGPYEFIERGETLRDAAQIAFSAGKVEPMPLFALAGSTGAVTLWQWNSHWQRAFETAQAGVIGDRTPDNIADMYPYEGEILYYPARAAGNENARESRSEPAEAMIAARNSGLKLHPDARLVGRGSWSGGKWRVHFVRPLVTPGDPGPIFSNSRTTFAVSLWDGGQGDRGASRAVSTPILLYADVPMAANTLRVAANWPQDATAASETRATRGN